MAPLPFCVCVSYLYANELGRACWVVRLYVRVKEKKAGVARVLEQPLEENLEHVHIFLFQITRPQLHPELCLPLSSFSVLFPLYSDEILLFRYTVWMSVWLEILWHETHLLYLTEMPNAAVSSDWQAHTPSAQQASPLHSLMVALHSLLGVTEMRPSGLSGSQCAGNATFVCLWMLLLMQTWVMSYIFSASFTTQSPAAQVTNTSKFNYSTVMITSNRHSPDVLRFLTPWPSVTLIFADPTFPLIWTWHQPVWNMNKCKKATICELFKACMINWKWYNAKNIKCFSTESFF